MAGGIDFIIDTSELRTMQGRFAGLNELIEDDLETLMEDIGEQLVSFAEKITPFDHSMDRDDDKPHAAESWEWTDVTVRGQTISADLHNSADQMTFILEGARPHLILGNPLLAFMAGDGTMVYTTVVNHPGMQPSGFLEKFNEEVYRILIPEVEASMIATIQRIT